MIHNVRMSEKKLEEFKAFLEEQKVDTKDISTYLSEEMSTMELKAQVIKALNCLDAMSSMVDTLQLKTYVKPCFEKLMALKDELG